MFINLFHLQYPYCTSLDLQELFNGSMHTPTQIFFNLKANHEKLGFSFYAEDRNKKLEKRPLKSNMMAYVGPDISKQNLRKPSNLKLMFSIYQYIDPEADEKIPAVVRAPTHCSVHKLVETNKFLKKIKTF